MAEGAEGQGVGDLIFQETSVGTIRLDAMPMLPARKRTGHLDIAKLPTLFVVTMFSDPAQTQRPGPHAEHHP
jgi:hypothetical protein